MSLAIDTAGSVFREQFGLSSQAVSLPEGDEQWYALQVKTRHERNIAQLLQDKGYDSFCPGSRQQKQWCDRVHEFEAPLFPGYVFCRFDARFRLPILTTPGVRYVVGYGRVPVSIVGDEIDAVRRVAASKLAVEPCSYLAEGSRVRIVRGALAGLEGVLIKVRSSYRMVLSVSLIQRSVRVEVDPEMIAAASDSEANYRYRAAS